MPSNKRLGELVKEQEVNKLHLELDEQFIRTVEDLKNRPWPLGDKDVDKDPMDTLKKTGRIKRLEPR